jgi:topoisomerase-4 subunit A
MILSTGEFKLIGYDLSTHFDSEMVHIRKLNDNEIITAVYFDGDQEKYYVKRFQLNGDLVLNRKYSFISDGKGSKLIGYSVDYLPRIEVEIKSKVNNEIEFEVLPLADFIGVKSYKAKGKRLSNKDVRKIKFIDPLPYTPPESDKKDEEKELEMATEEESLSKASVNEKEEIEKESSEQKKESLSEKKPPKSDEKPPQMELEF